MNLMNSSSVQPEGVHHLSLCLSYIGLMRGLSRTILLWTPRGRLSTPSATCARKLATSGGSSRIAPASLRRSLRRPGPAGCRNKRDVSRARQNSGRCADAERYNAIAIDAGANSFSHSGQHRVVAAGDPAIPTTPAAAENGGIIEIIDRCIGRRMYRLGKGHLINIALSPRVRFGLVRPKKTARFRS
jgi:hypothetical protein